MTETEIMQAMQELTQELLRLRAKKGKTQADKERLYTIDKDYGALADKLVAYQRKELQK